MSGEQKPLTGTSGPTTRGHSAGTTLRSKDDASSLFVLEILLYFNRFYIGLFWLFEILMFIYKGQSLAYPFGILAGEVILVFAIAIADLIRVYLCSYGNLAGNRVSTGLGIAVTLLAALGVIYLLFFQTYTLRAELITCSFALIFHLLGIILSVAALISMT